MSSRLAVRLVLTAVAVLLCYQFQWNWLRYLTSEFNLRLDALVGVHLQRLTFDTVMWKGVTYRYVVACTMADVFCGAIPLIVNIQVGIKRNMQTLAWFAVGLFAFNVFRLSFSDAIFALGLNWNLAHNVVSGISYFLIWEWILRRRAWTDGTR